MSVLDPASDDGRVGTVQAGGAATETADRRGARRPLVRSQPEPLQAVIRQDNDVDDVIIHDADNDEIDPLRGMPRLVPRRLADVDDDNDYDNDACDNDSIDFDACVNENDGNNSPPTRTARPWTHEGMPRLVPTWPHEEDGPDDEDYGNNPWQLPLHIAGPGASRSTNLIRDLIERWPDEVEEGGGAGLHA
jgi:hypothetical protein